MPGSVHPLLMRNETDDATTVVESPEDAVNEAPSSGDDTIVSASESFPQEAEAAQEEPYWKLDRKNPIPDFQRLLQESPEFANKYNADVGRKAQRKYQPEIEKERARADALEAQLQQARFQSAVSRMDETEVQQRLRTDPNFARMYHGQRDIPNVAARTEQIEWAKTIEDVIDYGISNGLPEQVDGQIKQAVASGRYDYEYDAQGRPVRQLSQQEGLLRLQRDVAEAVNYVRAQRSAPPPAPQARPAAQAAVAPQPKPAQPIGAANPAVQVGADVSAGIRAVTGRPRMAISEFRSRPWDEQVGPNGLYKNMGEFKSAIASGELYQD